MNVLHDTHVWLWTQAAPEQMGARTARLLARSDTRIHVSPVSTLEIARLTLARQLSITVPLLQWVLDTIADLDAETLPVTHDCRRSLRPPCLSQGPRRQAARRDSPSPWTHAAHGGRANSRPGKSSHSRRTPLGRVGHESRSATTSESWIRTSPRNRGRPSTICCGWSPTERTARARKRYKRGPVGHFRGWACRSTYAWFASGRPAMVTQALMVVSWRTSMVMADVLGALAACEAAAGCGACRYPKSSP